MSVLFKNNAQSSLASTLNTTATTATVLAGTGSVFPSPTGSDYFVMTLADQTTQTIREIVWVTNVTGDTLTIVRAQEGTAALDWVVGDVAANWLTAGQMQLFTQGGGAAGGVLSGTYPDPGFATGAVNTAALGAGAVTTANVAANNITNALLAAMAATTVKGSVAGGTPIDITFATLFSYLGFGASSIGADGYITFPGGLMMQWGTATVFGSGASHAVDTANFNGPGFPTACFGVTGSPQINDSGNPNTTGNNITAIFYSFAKTTFDIRLDSEQGNTLSGSYAVFWIALGN
jgi:hypothetical protein